jgi:acetyl/propionyl-CoA carboxylase alpha subunit
VKRVLVANRGEIAVRVIRACHEMGLEAVAVYSDCDRAARHVQLADFAFPIGPNPPADSYLRIDRLIDAARRAGADAVHPGYGFLAENAAFARACRDAGLTFIGPSPDAIALMGSKTAARAVATAAGVPVVPGTQDPLGAAVSDAEIAAIAASVGYPVLIKAVAGGGGKGMRVVSQAGDLASAIRAARSEARSAFGVPDIYVERRLDRPRHVEVQVLGDEYGTVVPFVERECSIQRRHQKIVEESPSPVVTPAIRRQLVDAAAAIARRAGYTNAGTMEFLLDASGRFYFLEMNTRLQVEHPVTELVTRTDLVQAQIRIARGERLHPTAQSPRGGDCGFHPTAQSPRGGDPGFHVDPEEAMTPHGHAIECRIYAEDPDHNFFPSPGRVSVFRAPSGPGLRLDEGVTEGDEVPIFYDPLIAKLAAWAESRPQAIARMNRALAEYEVRGIKTTIPFFQWLLGTEDFQQARFDTTFVDAELARRNGRPFVEATGEAEELAAAAAALHEYLSRASTSGGRSDAPGRVSPWAAAARAAALR